MRRKVTADIMSLVVVQCDVVTAERRKRGHRPACCPPPEHLDQVCAFTPTHLHLATCAEYDRHACFPVCGNVHCLQKNLAIHIYSWTI